MTDDDPSAQASSALRREGTNRHEHQVCATATSRSSPVSHQPGARHRLWGRLQAGQFAACLFPRTRHGAITTHRGEPAARRRRPPTRHICAPGSTTHGDLLSNIHHRGRCVFSDGADRCGGGHSSARIRAWQAATGSGFAFPRDGRSTRRQGSCGVAVVAGAHRRAHSASRCDPRT
jgi:hypothetical protein